MGIVSGKDVARSINLDGLGGLGTFIGRSLMQLTQISKVNRVYDKHKHLHGVEFIDAILIDLGINFEVPEKDLKRIPQKGAFVTVSNHPLGGVDGLLLLKLMLQHRDDYKVMGNFLLQRIFPISDYILPVNPFENRKEVKSSSAGIKNSFRHIDDGKPLGVFPAGEVATKRSGNQYLDKAWSTDAMRMIKKLNVPVVPVYFHAKNSPSFYKIAQINDTLRTAKLPSELFTQRYRKIRVRIGQPISIEDQAQQENLEEYTNFIRKKTYMLASGFDRKRWINQIPSSIKIPRSPKNVIKETEKENIKVEIEQCRQADKKLFTSNSFEVFLSPSDDIPVILREIGRLREITFRLIGEGTNRSIDLDKYDHIYHHLFLWDDKNEQLAGAYRMGLGQEIFPEYGMGGFYLNELFRFETEAHRIMKETIEMGRAFISKDYQQKPMPLFLLWRGIVHCTIRYPEHKYLMGGVSISNQFSNFSKSLMIEFMKSNYYDPFLAQYIRPKKEFKVKLKDEDKDFFFDAGKANLNKFDKLIDEIEPNNLRMPVLLKKYVKQNAKVIAFNVDPLFNNAVDGLMYIKIKDLPASTVNPVLEELQNELENK
jgi:putative hemolysin